MLDQAAKLRLANFNKAPKNTNKETKKSDEESILDELNKKFNQIEIEEETTSNDIVTIQEETKEEIVKEEIQQEVKIEIKEEVKEEVLPKEEIKEEKTIEDIIEEEEILSKIKENLSNKIDFEEKVDIIENKSNDFVVDTITSNRINKPKIITVTSGKGGVGKTNFTVNLSISLSKLGKKVIIFDADMGMSNVDILLGLNSRGSIFDIINDNKDLDDVVLDTPYGIQVVPGGSGLSNIEDLTSEQRQIFLSKIDQIDDVDYIIIDTGAGISKSVLSFISCAQEVFFVTTPEPTSITDAYSLLKATSNFNIRKSAKIIVNKSSNVNEAKATFNRINSVVNNFLDMDLEFAGYILDDRNVVNCVKKQSPFTIEYPNSNASKCINSISRNIVNSKTEGESASKLFKKIFSMFN